ncbi:MAG: hypothetical protein ACI4XE_00770 [Acutalibacteraceae bacterium]
MENLLSLNNKVAVYDYYILYYNRKDVKNLNGNVLCKCVFTDKMTLIVISIALTEFTVLFDFGDSFVIVCVAESCVSAYFFAIYPSSFTVQAGILYQATLNGVSIIVITRLPENYKNSEQQTVLDDAELLWNLTFRRGFHGFYQGSFRLLDALNVCTFGNIGKENFCSV